ncbi:MAG: hypothetical protein UT05_C0006G0055 [Parcubacteria group bacterium GW2011_GWF2_38_76]|nr:MAG: hypothetical protein UT05_C0006G0055 [Parcubacteria group bacterium GW2011_GWF2_38_76]HBM45846.1 hypothetical protein [Patescibacteria group bacterium]
MVKSKKTIKESKKTDTQTDPSCIVVFGAAGYVGRMLCDQFCSAPSVKEIIAIDRLPMPDILKRKKKITWIEADLSQDDWHGKLIGKEPEIAIHTAWDFEKGGDEIKNLNASEKIFEFCFNRPSINKIIYLSSILPYGATSDNNRDRMFSEGEILRENEYSYAVNKKEVESLLARQYSGSNRTKNVFVLRPGIIYGPMGASIPSFREPLLKILDSLPYFFKPDNDYGLQYVHEDDLVDLNAVLVFNKVPFKGYEVFNVVTSKPLDSSEIAVFLKKQIVDIPYFLVRLFFTTFGARYSEELTQKGVWKYLYYPVFADGSKLVKKLKFEFIYSTKEVAMGECGRYSHLAPKKEEGAETKE